MGSSGLSQPDVSWAVGKKHRRPAISLSGRRTSAGGSSLQAGPSKWVPPARALVVSAAARASRIASPPSGRRFRRQSSTTPVQLPSARSAASPRRCWTWVVRHGISGCGEAAGADEPVAGQIRPPSEQRAVRPLALAQVQVGLNTVSGEYSEPQHKRALVRDASAPSRL
jgi:hypothetical protein